MALHSLGENATPFFAGQMDHSHLFLVMNYSRVHTDPREDLHNTVPAATDSQFHELMFVKHYEVENNFLCDCYK